jgi:endo-1,4-beta-xylanase
MKRTLIVLLLANLILSACAPVSAPTSTPAPSATPLPTATTAPTSTATPTSTPTATPTATPTLIPTIQVGSLSVPDPRVTNPELFDLRNPNASIPQFVNAMRMAGIEITAERVAQGITYEALKGKNGNLFVVAVYSVDPNLFPQQYHVLYEPVPLLIAEKRESGWNWRKITESLRTLADSRNFLFGSQIVYYKLSDSHYTSLASGNFNFFTSSGEIDEPDLWKMNNPNQPYDYDFSRIDRLLRFARQSNVNVFHAKNLIEPRVYPDHGFWPQWVLNLRREELQKVVHERITTIMLHLRETYLDGDIIYSVVSEAFDWNNFTGFVYEKLGSRYIETCYRTARETDPNAILIYEDVTIFHEGKIDDHDRAAISLVEKLKQQNLIDGAGLEMHLNANRIPSPEVFRQLIRAYKNLGIKVYITEFDIDFGDFRGSTQDKQLLKAKVYGDMLRVAIEEQVDGFAMFGFSGIAAWHPDGLILDEKSQPTIAFYSVASVLLSRVTK